MGEIPAFTTPAEAYELAKRAQRRGSTWMQVTCSAEGRRFARQVTRPWRDQRHLICPGFVTRRWFDADGIVQALTVTVDAFTGAGSQTSPPTKRCVGSLIVEVHDIPVDAGSSA